MSGSQWTGTESFKSAIENLTAELKKKASSKISGEEEYLCFSLALFGPKCFTEVVGNAALLPLVSLIIIIATIGHIAG